MHLYRYMYSKCVSFVFFACYSKVGTIGDCMMTRKSDVGSSYDWPMRQEMAICDCFDDLVELVVFHPESLQRWPGTHVSSGFVTE